MKKIYHFMLKGKLNVLFLLGFVGLGFSQNIQQRQAIMRQSNLTELQRIGDKVRRETPKVSELRAMAKKIGVKYSDTYKGVTYKFSGIYKDGTPRYLRTYNAGAAATTGTNKLYKEAGIFDLTGKGMTVGEWDGGGVLTSHVELVGRVTQMDNPNEVNEHSTHVAGTLIAKGVQSQAKGMAYEAHLNAYEWTDDVAEMADAASKGLLLSNHSYGFNAGFVYGQFAGSPGWYWFGDEDETEDSNFGKYQETDIEWDNVMYRAPYYLAVKAAGNARGDGPEPGGRYFIRKGGSWGVSTATRAKNGGEYGFDCITGGTVGKNLLVVGAVEKIPNGYTKPSDVKISSFSSFGPTDDGRIKPDIVGAGVNIFSSTSESNNSYGSLSGTSMASPNVTGSLLLLQQLYSKLNHGEFMKAATLKALILNTADEAGDAPGPDYKYGFGLLDDFKAAQAISTKDKYSIFKEQQLKQGKKNTITVKAAGNGPLKVTLVWQDPAPLRSDLTSYGVLNDRKKMLVNDLDIVVLKDGKKYYPWKLDPEHPNNPATTGVNDIDNVEQVVIDKPEKDAEYTIEITHKGILKMPKDGKLVAGSQDYSVVATGLAMIPVKDISVDKLEIKVDRAAYTDKTPVAVTFTNLSNKDIKNAKIKYTFTNEDNNQIVKQGEIPIHNLKARETKTEEFQIDLSHSFINYKIKAELDYKDDQVLVNNTQSVNAYGILKDLVAEKSRLDYGFEQSLSKEGWTLDYKNSTTNTWIVYQDPKIARTGLNSLVNFTQNRVPDAWVYTNPLRLKGGQSYRVVYYAMNAKNYNDKFRVAFGTMPDGSKMTPIGQEINLKTGKFIRYYVEFTPQADGVYYVGFHNYTDNNDQSYGIVLDDITIMNTNGIPYADFSASNYEPSTFDKVAFNNESLSGPAITSYEWKFSPNSVTFLDGTSRSSENPIVKFNRQGNYDVTLKVTNTKGDSQEFKQEYIKVFNEPVEVNFKASKNVIDDNTTTKLMDNSKGKPNPYKWKWEITPSKDVYFVEGTTENSQSPTVLFGRDGSYSVKLTATSLLGAESKTEESYIKVNGKHYPVNNLSYKQRVNRIDLRWDRPDLKPIYVQNFEEGGRMPSGITLIDEDGDGQNWFIENDLSNVIGSYSAESLSEFSENGKTVKRDIKNWLVTNKISSGAEQISLDVKTYGHQKFKVYVLPVDKEQTPSLRQIKLNGDKVFEFDGNESKFKNISIDISKFRNKDLYVAILHCSRKSDEGKSLIIDNLQVGYKRYDNRPVVESNRKELDLTKVDLFRPFYKDEFVDLSGYQADSNNQENNSTPIDELKLIGYEVVRNGVTLKTIKDINDTKIVDILDNSNTYKYDVYALYSDNKKSIWQSVTVDAKFTIPTVQKGLDKNGIVVYPNPTNGIFNIKLPKDATFCKLSLYDITGRLISIKENVIEQEQQNFKYLKAGVYILKIVDNKGREASFKLMKK